MSRLPRPRAHRSSRRRRTRKSGGQSLVEFAIVLPFLMFLLGGVYTVWTALHEDIGLTNAARAGAIEAVSKLNKAISTGGHPPAPPAMCAALKAAQAGVAAEENVAVTAVGINDPNNWCGVLLTCASKIDPCVSINWSTRPLATGGQSYYVTQLTINQQIAPKIPLITGIHVSATAIEDTE